MPLKKFSVEAHAEAGFIVMPHTHAVDENIVILKGSWALGMGEQYRIQKADGTRFWAQAADLKTGNK